VLVRGEQAALRAPSVGLEEIAVDDRLCRKLRLARCGRKYESSSVTVAGPRWWVSTEQGELASE
jgi:hypothetical protein